MPKGNKIATIQNILSAAEELFSEKGFNGTSVNMIAEKAGVNKALIYYHFKDKDDIVNSLFENIIKESDEYINRFTDKEASIQDAIKEEIAFMQRKKKILAVMLMESLKADDRSYYFFQCAEKVIQGEMDGEEDPKNSEEVQRYLAYEFFTGFIPMMMFIIFRDKWCEYFDCDVDALTRYFMDSFTKTHLASKN